MNESVKRHEENSNLIKEFRASIDPSIRIQGASIKALEIQIGQKSKVLQERGFGSLPSSTETNPRDHVNSISTIVETDMTPIRRIGSTQYAISAQQNSKLIFELRQTTIPFPNHLYDDCYEEENGSYGFKDLDAYSIGTTLRNDALPQKEKDPGSFTLPWMVKYPKGITKNVLVGIGKFVFPVDFIIIDMPEDVNVPLILRRPFLSTTHAKVDISFDPLYGDDIDLNDLNEPQELKRNRVDNLEPTIEEGEVVNEPMIDIVKTRCDFIGGLDDYPIVEDMDPYLDEGMGEVVVGEPFCKVSFVETKRFNGIITIRNEDDNVTYQMVRLNLRFKHLTNEQCNKIPPLLKDLAGKKSTTLVEYL
ncbi:hypothetical protein Tco_0315847 [Tanacetum coccineum]